MCSSSCPLGGSLHTSIRGSMGGTVRTWSTVSAICQPARLASFSTDVIDARAIVPHPLSTSTICPRCRRRTRNA